MKEEHLYQQIAEKFRQEILSGKYGPGDRLPSIRFLTRQWNCTPGTIQRAFKELAEQNLVTSRTGKGTSVNQSIPAHNDAFLRRASLIHRAEAFILEATTQDHSTEEIHQAFTLALDRWQSQKASPPILRENAILFCGSHDLAVSTIAEQFSILNPQLSFLVTYAGSLGGLIALAEGKAHLAGCHLWDEETDTYNIPFIRRLLPNQRTAVITLSHRRLGLLLPPANPLQIHSLADLTHPEVTFINRQPGAGTRVWLDSQLHANKIDPACIHGYAQICNTHSEVARAIAEGQANAGLGLEAYARIFGLDYVHLTLERYDLVIPETTFNLPAIQALVEWIRLPETARKILQLGGYSTNHTGELTWIQ
jgi:molybdate-binding protein/DNA-binding transcriptional regulator YhcF (GntR family)